MRPGTGADPWDILRKPAQWLWKKREAKLRHGSVARKRMEALTALYGQVKAAEEYQRFQIGKYERLLALALAGTALSAGLLGVSIAQGAKTVTALERPVTGEGSQKLTLGLQIGDGPPAQVSLDMPEREFRAEEEEWLLNEAQERLTGQMEGADWDPDAVSENISLPGQLCGGLVEVSWQSSNYDLMDGAGQIRKDPVDEEGETVTLTARLSCGDSERMLTFPLRIVPKETGAAARIVRDVERKMRKEGEADSVGLP